MEHTTTSCRSKPLSPRTAGESFKPASSLLLAAACPSASLCSSLFLRGEIPTAGEELLQHQRSKWLCWSQTHKAATPGGAGRGWGLTASPAGQARAQHQDNRVPTQGGTSPVSRQAAGACPGEVAVVGPLGTRGILFAEWGRARVDERSERASFILSWLEIYSQRAAAEGL